MDPLSELQARFPREVDIRDDDVRPNPLQHASCFECVVRSDHIRAAVLEDLHQQDQGIVVVVDNEDLVVREVVLPKVGGGHWVGKRSAQYTGSNPYVYGHDARGW